MYKIKRFTRGEKEAFKEIYKATGGFRHLPQGGGARDVLRFNKFATDLRQLAEGNSKAFDRENAKGLLNNVGLTKSAGQVDKLVDKYTNKRALARLRRMKNKGLLFRDTKEGERYTAASKISLNGRDEFNKNSKKLVEDLRNGQGHDKKIVKKIKSSAKKRGIKVRSNPNIRETKQGESSAEFYIDNTTGKRIPGKRIDGNNYYELAEYHPKANEGIISHEVGHIRTNLSPNGVSLLKSRQDDEIKDILKSGNDYSNLGSKNKTLQEVAKNISEIADENSASSYGLANLKRLGVSKDKLKELKKSTDTALGTYIGLGVERSANKVMDSLW